jgi:hypothetical protein
MTPADYLRNRNGYFYPAVGLIGTFLNYRQKKFLSTEELDQHQNRLLSHESNENVVLGYLSTIYWGHYSGKDRIERPERALGKVRLARDGRDRERMGKRERIKGVRDIGLDAVAATVREAIDQLAGDRYGEALELLSSLPQLQVAFGSKVCAFLAPRKCGVIDSVIAEKNPGLGFLLDKSGIVKNIKSNRDSYRPYCLFLQDQAERLNSIGRSHYWTDRDGARYAWRALDVERAMY